MSLFNSFRNLTPRTRILVGASFLAWGTLGLYITDRAESRFGLEASESDREALGRVVPSVRVVEREGGGR
ncbi:hypothetical protein BKA65DRAFT_466740 [Rhexocercosporidium sp. MPI-PUGE-AT-0058]|nr:hypothetical protein BKA65DRAFT_466740 [Rhexocercosporidium sp. MPI-PUGE-AT-0058]